MAAAGSPATAKVYDDTPYTHPVEVAANTRRSNLEAHALVGHLIGVAQLRLELTTPPGGGASGGATYTIGYLNELTGGGFTGDLAVAATGTIDEAGKVGPIQAIDEKLVAAAVAGADVVFTPSRPQEQTAADIVARRDGRYEAINMASSRAAVGERWDEYVELGASRPAGVDVVGVRHLGDVAAYLCGAGTSEGCRTLELIESHVHERLRSAANRPVPERSGQPTPDGVR